MHLASSARRSLQELGMYSRQQPIGEIGWKSKALKLLALKMRGTNDLSELQRGSGVCSADEIQDVIKLDILKFIDGVSEK
jgi:hypothetical protein